MVPELFLAVDLDRGKEIKSYPRRKLIRSSADLSRKGSADVRLNPKLDPSDLRKDMVRMNPNPNEVKEEEGLGFHAKIEP